MYSGLQIADSSFKSHSLILLRLTEHRNIYTYTYYLHIYLQNSGFNREVKNFQFLYIFKQYHFKLI